MLNGFLTTHIVNNRVVLATTANDTCSPGTLLYTHAPYHCWTVLLGKEDRPIDIVLQVVYYWGEPTTKLIGFDFAGPYYYTNGNLFAR
jgi:hypothetical protein